MTNIPETHIILVSDQPMPSLLPLLDPGMAARKALLVVTQQRRHHAEWLAAALQSRGLEVETCELEAPYDMDYLQAKFHQLIKKHPEGVATNISGGNKLMSIAAYESCKSAQQPVYYVNIETDSVQWLFPEKSNDHPLTVTMQLETYLQSCGVAIQALTRDPYPTNWRPLASEIFNNRKLFSCVQKIKHGQDISDIIKTSPFDYARLLELNILKNKSGEYDHANNLASQFLMGGWYELVVHDAIKNISLTGVSVQDAAMNLKIAWKTSENSTEPLANEFDVVALINNTLYLIECKSGKHTKQKADELRKVILQLGKSRAKLGGLRGRAALVSRLPITPSMEARCSENMVETFFTDGLKLKGFQDHIHNLIQVSK
jgi:hypothetical protein